MPARSSGSAPRASDWEAFEAIFKPTRIPKAAEILADRLRTAIVSGQLSEGLALPPEAQLLKTFGVGRPALREALHILESESLLQIRRGVQGGAFVTLPTRAVPAQAAGRLLQFNRTNLDDVYETQTILEAAAAARVAFFSSPQQRQHLHDLIDEWETAGDPEGWIRANIRFHEALLDSAGLNALALLGGMLREITARQTEVGTADAVSSGLAEAMSQGARAPRKLMRLIDSQLGVEASTFWTTYRARVATWWFELRSGQTVLDLFDKPPGRAENGRPQPKLASSVAASLRQRIVRGELREGDTLPSELKLAQQLGVGLPTLREALRVLETESLLTVDRGAHGGARIQAPSAAAAARPAGMLLQMQGTTVDDVQETHALLETAAARRIAVQGDAAALAVLTDLCAQGSQALGNPRAWADHAARFEAKIMELAGLKSLEFLASILEQITARHGLLNAPAPIASPVPNEVALQAHRQLVAFIRAQDPSGVEAFWPAYLSSVRLGAREPAAAPGPTKALITLM